MLHSHQLRHKIDMWQLLGLPVLHQGGPFVQPKLVQLGWDPGILGKPIIPRLVHGVVDHPDLFKVVQLGMGDGKRLQKVELPR
jgi:hypothetical protein